MSTGHSLRFAELVAGPEAEIPLDEAAVLIAAHARPRLDVSAVLGRLDVIAAACPEATLDGLLRYLFSELGFRGDTDNYGDPANSYLDDVLDRRLGIPITLSVLTMEVGRRLGVPLAGIGMPGHFLVRHRGEPPVFFDPFGRGQRLDEAGCEAIFRRLGGTGPFASAYLEPVGARAILSRMLVNLQNTFLPRDLRSAAWVMQLRLAVPGLPWPERRHLARVLGSLGQFEAAGAELERLAASVPAAQAAGLEVEARALRARAN